MKDTIIKGNGKSRIVKAPADMPETFDEWRTQLLAGNAYLDVALNTDTTGTNAGVDVLGTAQNKANLLSDTTKNALELTQSDPTVDNALYALSQKGSPAEVHFLVDANSTVTMTKNGKTLSAVANSSGWAILYPTTLGEWSVSYVFGGSQKARAYTLEVIGIVYVYPFVIGDSLENTTWDNINICSQLGMAEQFFKVGDTKTVSVDGTNYQVQIIGFNHDTKTAGGKAGISFQMVDCLNTTYNMNSSDTNSEGWTSSAMRGRMSTFLGQLPSALQTAIKAVNKLTSAGSQSATINTTSDKLFLLSEIEIFGTVTNSKAGEGTQYDWYKAGNSKIKKVNGSANAWGGRSPHGSNTTNFCAVGSNGGAGYNDASSARGVSFGFCV